jgi:tetratricopeptide (TPR) repeat protein
MKQIDESLNVKAKIARDFVKNEQWIRLLSYSQNWAKEEPEVWLAYYFIGCAAHSLELYDLAISSDMQALGLNPSDQRIWENLAAAFEEKGDLKSSIASLLEGIEACKETQNIDLILAAGHHMGRNGNDSEALEYFKRALVENPKSKRAIDGVMIALRELKREPELLDLISNSIQDFPYLAESYNQLTRDSYNYKEITWALHDLHILCKLCKVNYGEPHYPQITSYFKFGSVLVESISEPAFCKKCKAVTTGLRCPVTISHDQITESINKLRKDAVLTPQNEPATSWFSKLLGRVKTSDRWVKLQKRIELEESILAISGEIGIVSKYVSCQQCGVADAYTIKYLSRITSTSTLTNIRCPECSHGTELIGTWKPFRHIRFQPFHDPENDGTASNQFWVISDRGAGISKVYTENPILVRANDHLFEAGENFRGVFSSMCGFVPDPIEVSRQIE